MRSEEGETEGRRRGKVWWRGEGEGEERRWVEERGRKQGGTALKRQFISFFFFKQKTAYEMLGVLVDSRMCIGNRIKIFFFPDEML